MLEPSHNLALSCLDETMADVYSDGLQGNPNTMEWLLQRKPTQIAEWARMEIDAVESGKTKFAREWLAEHR